MTVSTKRLGVAAGVLLSFAACARQVNVTSGTAAGDGTLRVTNNLAEPVEVYAKNGSTDVYLRRIGSHSTESFRIPGYAPGALLQLTARTPSGTVLESRDAIELGSATCPESHLARTPNRGCEWSLP